MPYIGQSPYQVAFLVDTFSGNGSTTAFTTSVAPANTASVLVAISGVVQDPSTYSVSGTTLTFSAAPPTGTGNISARYLGIPASGVTTTAYRTITEFTATAGQTTFTPPSYTVGFIQVYRNGVLLGSADYTATNGTTVVLTTGATAGDLITTISFYVSSVLNAIPATANSVANSYLGTITTLNTPGSNTATFPSNLTWTKIQFNTKLFDTNTNFDAGTNYRFTPTVAGYYQINATITGPSGGTYCAVSIYKTGSLYIPGGFISNLGAGSMPTVSGVLYLNGSTDYVECYGYQNTGGSASMLTSGQSQSYFSASMVRSA